MASEVLATMRRGAMPQLPYDAEVEWLKSTDKNQYIATGLIPSADTKVEFEYKSDIPSQIGTIFIFGEFNSGNTASVTFGEYSGFARFGSGYLDNVFKKRGVFHQVKGEVGKWTIDGVEHAFTSGWSGDANEIRLFSLVGVTSYHLVSFSYCKIFSADILVRDFISVRVGPRDNCVGYMYDRANPTGGPLGNGLYPNAGNGAFEVGPDKQTFTDNLGVLMPHKEVEA